MSALTPNIVSFIHKMGIVPLSRVMQLLVDMVTTDAEDGCSPASTVCTVGSSPALVSLCCSMVPENLIKSLLEQIASEMVYCVVHYWRILALCLQKYWQFRVMN